MKTLYKILLFTSVVLFILLSGIAIYIYISGPALPDRTNEIIENVIKQPLPELVTGESGLATSQGLDIWYESIAPEDSTKGTILLIMGISNDALG